MTDISSPGAFPAGNYTLTAHIAGSLLFTGPSNVDLRGFTVDLGGSGNTWDYAIVMQGAGSVLGDSIGSGRVTGGRVGVKLEGAGSKIVGVDLSYNRYFGAWLAADDCEVNGGAIGDIGGVTDEKYAIGIQCDHASPVVRDVRFSEMYPQAGYTGPNEGEGLPVNFAASSTDGLMEECIASNQSVTTNTYGVFGGSGGGHVIRNNCFVNFWRGISAANAGLPVIEGNRIVTEMALPNDFGVQSPAGTVEKNIIIGYRRPFTDDTDSDGNFFATAGKTEILQPAPTVPGEMFSASLPGVFGNIGTKTVRVKIPASLLTVTGAQAEIRLTLQGASGEPLSLDSLYIGHQGGTEDWHATSLTLVSPSLTVPAGVTLQTEWAPFIWNGTSDLIVSFYCSDTTDTADLLAANDSVPGAVTFAQYGDVAAIPDALGFTAYAGYLSLVTAIETG